MSPKRETLGGESRLYSGVKRGMAVLGMGAVGITAAACTGEFNESNTDVRARSVDIYCFAEEPNCTAENAFAVEISGNSYSVDVISPVCVDGITVDGTKESEVDPDVIELLIWKEDAEFCNHDGRDWRAFVRSAIGTLFGNQQGGSTLTMQLARNLDQAGVPQDVIERKLWEVFVAAPELEATYTKTEIMNKYLNIVYFGRGAFGIEAAAQAYFGKSAEFLSKLESGYLAGLVENPGKYEGSKDQTRNAIASQHATEQRDYVLKQSVGQGRLFATQAELDTVYAEESASFNVISYDSLNRTNLSVVNELSAQFAFMYIKDEKLAILNKANSDKTLRDNSGRIITTAQNAVINTTISRTDQTSLANAVRNNPLGPGEGTFGGIIIDETAGITGYKPGIFSVNGPNIDLIHNPGVDPIDDKAAVIGGSIDKWKTAVILLQNGFTLDTPIEHYNSYTWENYDGNGKDYTVTEVSSNCKQTDGGPRIKTLQETIRDSCNTGIVKSIDDLEMQGIPALGQTFEFYGRLNEASRTNFGPATILGGSEKTPAERAVSLMQVIGLDGKALTSPRFINSIVLESGETIYEYTQPDLGVVLTDPTIPEDIRKALLSVVESGTASKNLSPLLQYGSVYAKTGTGEDKRVAGISVGFPDAKGDFKVAVFLQRESGGLGELTGDVYGGGKTGKLAHDTILPIMTSS